MKLDRIFTSHMVFAAGKPIRIYGEGQGRVTVSLAGQSKTAVFEGEKWLVELPETNYGGPYDLTVRFDDRTEVLNDIYVGEVYLFAGQSNMQFKMRESSTPFGEDNGKLRMFCTDRLAEGERFSSSDGWVVCSKENSADWSAIAYHTANEISKKGVAVGVVACYQGASTIESWVLADTFKKIGIEIPADKKHIDHVYEPFKAWQNGGDLYNFAFSQVKPFSFSAVVWYQGESDTTPAEGEVYGDELCELIKIWRKDLSNDSLPFVIIQIADYVNANPEGWRLVQEAQLKVQERLPCVKTVISRDVCENAYIHPPTKDKLAKRVAKVLEEI